MLDIPLKQLRATRTATARNKHLSRHSCNVYDTETATHYQIYLKN